MASFGSSSFVPGVVADKSKVLQPTAVSPPIITPTITRVPIGQNNTKKRSSEFDPGRIEARVPRFLGNNQAMKRPNASAQTQNEVKF